jgi:acetylglutamate kinase
VKRIVVKIGGHALDSLSPRSPVLNDLADDVAELRRDGVDVAIVHGGGPQIADLLESVGMAGEFHEGLRVTSALTMGYVAMALSHVNLRITAALNRAGLRSVGLSGADDTLLNAVSVGAPWDRVGGQPQVQTEVIESLWSSGVTPVLSSIALDQDGDLLNVNADTAAGALAGALGADVLVILSDVDQLRGDPDDPSSALGSVTGAQVSALIDSGAIREGMRPKMTAALDALGAGARRVVLANGTKRHALRDALAGVLPTTEVVP